MKLKIQKNKNLENLNFYKIKVVSKYFVELNIDNDDSEIYEIFEFIKKNKIKKYFILGSGANVIFKEDSYNGIIIKIKNKNILWIDSNIVNVGAGVLLDDFLKILQKKSEIENRKNLYDIQSLSLIPGTVGAGVFGNVGAFGTEIKKYVAGVKYFDIEKEEVIFDKYENLEFSYRNSFFKKNKNKYIILSVNFDFSQKFSKEIKEFYKNDEYFSLKHFSSKHNLGEIIKKEIRKNIINIRKNVYPNIKKFPNVGSTFKNVEIDKKQLKKILKKYPEIPHWELESEKVKIPTAYIFDKILKLNGKKFGNIKIHETRPLFFMNMGGATGKEFFNFCQKIKKIVEKKLDINLEEEVIFIE